MTSQNVESPIPLEELPLTDAGQTGDTATRHTVDAIPIDEIDAEWTQYFRYDTIYNDQQTAIESFLDSLANQDYYLKEGACGTGKTLAALTASVHAMRDSDSLSNRAPAGCSFPDYRRTMIVTPVKQQLNQFIGELRGVNETLPDEVEPIDTVVMRGQADMRAISNANLPNTDSREDIEDLRAMTRDLIKFDSDIPLDWPRELDPPPYSKVEYDWSDAGDAAERARENHQYDPIRARAIRMLVTQLAQSEGPGGDQLHIDGVETPYPEYVPHSSEVADVNRLQGGEYNQLPTDLQGQFDPFYAATFSRSQSTSGTFAEAPDSVIDRDALFSKAISNGRCPHELMCILAEQADVILGNYNHLLDPETRRLTDGKLGILDEKTIIVVDEAHQLERKSRDSFSTSLDLYTLDRARNDVTFARHYATGNISDSPTPRLSSSDAHTAKRIAKEKLGIETEEIGVRDLIKIEQVLDVAQQVLIDACEEIKRIKLSPRAGDVSAEAIENYTNPLAEPEHPEWGDKLTNALEAHDDLSVNILPLAEPVMQTIEDVYDALADEEIVDRTPQGRDVGAFLRQWNETPQEVYHPEVRAEVSVKESIPNRYPRWVQYWTPELRLFNCIPRRELRRVFAEVGGGVLMSATLRPADTFREATGVDAVPQPGAFEASTEDEDSMTAIRTNGITDEMVADHETRSTTFDRFPLRFPPDNRLSLVADLPKFTQRNRGDTNVDHAEMTDTRSAYATVIKQVAQTHGNILIAMPSYAEAAWAHEYLGTVSHGKRRLLDKASTADRTDRLLESFFADEDTILCTSLRGTITEGVDFTGDKLHTCLNVGVPQVPRDAEMDAVEMAYNRAISTAEGLEAAHLIPSTRKVRQSVGRVIRGADDIGVRILADERYGSHSENLREFLSPQQQNEFTVIDPEDVGAAVSRFWARE